MNRNVFLVFFIVLSLSVVMTAADIVENPAVPGNGETGKEPGRTVRLKEVLRISDEGGDFFFKSPRAIKIAGDNSIFVADDTHLLTFKPDGTFVRQFVKKGEGPGEVKYLATYWLGDKEIIVGSMMPTKIIHFDMDGKLVKEFRINSTEMIMRFIAWFGGRYYCRNQKMNFQSLKTGVRTAENQLLYSDEKGVITNLDFKVPIKQALVKETSGNNMMIRMKRITDFNSSLASGKFLYICSTERYLIHLFDLEKGKVTKSFRRTYQPVSFVPEPKEEDDKDTKLDSLYKRESFNDVVRLMTAGDNVWAITSTIDTSKGILVDVFNTAGKYIDNFYIQLPDITRPDDERLEKIIHHNGFLYIVEKDEEDTPSIVKYKMEI